MGQGRFSVGLQNLYPFGQTMEGHDLPVAHGHTCLQTNHAHHIHGGVNQSTCSIVKRIMADKNYFLSQKISSTKQKSNSRDEMIKNKSHSQENMPRSTSQIHPVPSFAPGLPHRLSFQWTYTC